MNVLHVITGLGVGGAETALFRLVASSKRRDMDHDIVSLGSGSDLLEKLESVAKSVTEFDIRPSLGLFGEVAKLRREGRKRNSDLIVGWMYHGNLAAHIVSRASDRPLVWNIRQSLYDISDEKWGTRTVIRAGRYLSDRPAAIIYNSHTSALHHQNFGFNRRASTVIPNGFDTTLFRPDRAERARIRRELDLSEDDVVIVCVARFHPVKNHGSLIAAAAEVSKRYEHVKLVLVGTDVTRENPELAEKTVRLEIDDKVRLCGIRDDVHAVYAAADIAVSASSAESFPNNVAEAMAAGLYCVATDVGDCREILSGAGTIVPPDDDAALATALAHAVEIGAAARDEAGLAARQRIQNHYTMQSTADRFLDLFNEVAGRGDKCAG